LDKIMEGCYRPGHFNGVVQVVYRLFKLVIPHCAYFGEKDRQQLEIIKKMVSEHSLRIKIIPCPIVRDKNGLALSSRNSLLSVAQKEKALLLYHSLCFVKEKFGVLDEVSIKEKVQHSFNSEANMDLEYFEIFTSGPFHQPNEQDRTTKVFAFIAATIGSVRLIDNICLKI